MSRFKLIVAIVALAIPLTTMPAGGQEGPDPSLVTGSVVLPPDAALPVDAPRLTLTDRCRASSSR